MNQKLSIEEQLEAWGTALRDRPRLTERVMEEIRPLAGQGEARTTAPQPVTPQRRRYLWALAGTLLTLSLGMVIVVSILPAPAVVWADVIQAVQSQKWIRGTMTSANGQQSMIWQSAESQVWAIHNPSASRFYDGRARVKYECQGRKLSIQKSALRSEEVENFLPIQALSQGQDSVSPWLFGTEKIVQQRRKEVEEDGKIWIEFHMVLQRGEMDQVTLRVDPATRLPVSLVLASSPYFWQKVKFQKWVFDYPAVGPVDIYDLDVPRDLPLDNLIPTDGSLPVIEAIAASRARIPDFRMSMSTIRKVGIGPWYHGYLVSRKGNCWRIDKCQEQAADESIATAINGPTWNVWFEERLKMDPPKPLYICDGKTVWENTRPNDRKGPRWKVSSDPAPQDLLSGSNEGLSGFENYASFAFYVYPDLFPRSNSTIVLAPNTGDNSGLILLNNVGLTPAPVVLGTVLVDPAKGHAVVRREWFGGRPGKPTQTITMENFQQSPQGFWYPTLLRDTPLFSQGGTLFGPPPPTEKGEATVRYHFDFEAELPDSLFTPDPQQIIKP